MVLSEKFLKNDMFFKILFLFTSISKVFKFDFGQGDTVKPVACYHDKNGTAMDLTNFHVFFETCFKDVNLAYGLAFGLFTMGLISSFTHCIGMCGPFMISQSDHLSKTRDAMLIPYHVGRIATYTILALIMASLVNVITFFSPLRILITVPLLSVAGILLIVNAFPKLQIIFPWANQFSLVIGQKYIRKLFSKSNNHFLMGMVLGLMPCGMVMGGIMAASTAPTYTSTAISMVAFGVGTMPGLVLAAIGGQKLQQKFPNRMPAVRAGFMIWSGLWLFAMAGLIVLRG
jgi:sulfite exporter TauE/SafE